MKRVRRKSRNAWRKLRRSVQGYGRPELHFLHIGKTGGSAIKSALRPLWASGDFRITFHGHGVTMFDIREGQPFFFAIRNPLDRFVSGFYSRQRQGRPLYDRPWSDREAAAFGRSSTASELAEALYADDSADAAMTAIEHVRSSYWDWFGDAERFLARRDDVFFVAHLERIDEDFVELAGKLGLAETAVLASGDFTTHRNPQDIDLHLSDAARANLTRWYERDFEFVDMCGKLWPP